MPPPKNETPAQRNKRYRQNAKNKKAREAEVLNKERPGQRRVREAAEAAERARDPEYYKYKDPANRRRDA